MTRIAEVRRRAEFNDAFDCGAEARRLSEEAERATADAGLFERILTDAEPLSGRIKRQAELSVETMRAEALAKRAMHDRIFMLNRDKPGFVDGYEGWA